MKKTDSENSDTSQLMRDPVRDTLAGGRMAAGWPVSRYIPWPVS